MFKAFQSVKYQMRLKLVHITTTIHYTRDQAHCGPGDSVMQGPGLLIQNTVCWQRVIQVCEIMPSCANCSVQIICTLRTVELLFIMTVVGWPGCLLVHSIIRLAPITQHNVAGNDEKTRPD